MSRSLVVYDATNGELRSVPKAFEAVGEYVASIVWKKQVGDAVESDDDLATVQWGNGSKEPLRAPTGCLGTIQRINRDIIYEELEFSPSQFFALIVSDQTV